MLLTDLYETTDYRSHRVENSNKTALKERLWEITGLLAEHFECSEDEICIGDVQFLPPYDEYEEEDDDLYYNPPEPCFISYTEEGEELPYYREYGVEVPYKVILGNVDFRYYRGADTGILSYIGGDADFYDNKTIRRLLQIKKICGDAQFADSRVVFLRELEFIGGDACFGGTMIPRLEKIVSIGGNAEFGNSKIKSLGQLLNIGGNANFEESQVSNLGKLRNIGGNAFFSNSNVKNLDELETIGGSAYFGIRRTARRRRYGEDVCASPITRLGKLKSIGKDAYFNGLGNVNTEQTIQVGGIAYFDSEEQIKECEEKICATSKKVGTGETISRRSRREQFWEEVGQRQREELAELGKIGQRQRQGGFIEFVNGVPSRL